MPAFTSSYTLDRAQPIISIIFVIFKSRSISVDCVLISAFIFIATVPVLGSLLTSYKHKSPCVTRIRGSLVVRA